MVYNKFPTFPYPLPLPDIQEINKHSDKSIRHVL